MPISTDERLAILQDLQRAWLALTRAVRDLSDDDLEQGQLANGWTIKVTMGHVTAWEQKLIDEIRHLERGEVFNWPHMDVFNPEQAALDASRPAAEIREDFWRTHDELIQLLETTPILSRELVASDTYTHYTDHTAQVMEWRKQTGRG